jgi:hypothetical protein
VGESMDDQTYCQLVEEGDKELFVGIFVPMRSILINMLLDGDRNCNYPVLKIKMPCGNLYEFNTREDLPMETLMCNCENLKHVVIKYSDTLI